MIRVPCPECGSRTFKVGKSPSVYYDTRHVCSECGCIFDIDRENVEDFKRTAFNSDILKHGAGRMAEVRQYAINEHPEIKDIANDPEVFRFILDYWDFVRWNEHGNECSYLELAEDGGFYFLVKDAAGETDEGLLDYLTNNGCDELLRRRAAIRRRYGVTGEHNRKRKSKGVRK